MAEYTNAYNEYLTFSVYGSLISDLTLLICITIGKVIDHFVFRSRRDNVGDV